MDLMSLLNLQGQQNPQTPQPNNLLMQRLAQSNQALGNGQPQPYGPQGPMGQPPGGMLQNVLNRTNQMLGQPNQAAYQLPPMPQMQQPQQPASPQYHIPGSLNPNQSQLMQALLSQAQHTFPNNPAMQQASVAMASRNAGLFNGGDPDQMARSGMFGFRGDGPNPGSPMMMRQNNSGPGLNPMTGQYMQSGGLGSMNIANQFNQFQQMLQQRRFQNASTQTTPQSIFESMGVQGGGPNNMNSYFQNNIAPIYGM